MPELPEVETIKNDLKGVILNKKIASVKVRDKKAVASSYDQFSKTLKNNTVKNISRIGKLLIIELANKKYLLIHLKMTGQLIYCAREKCIVGGLAHQSLALKALAGGHETDNEVGSPSKHTRVILEFSNGGVLYFNDMRRFGYLKIVNFQELEKIKSNFGIEPLTSNFKWSDFKRIFKGRKINVKSLLLNQKLISGIGNIYADEILFRAGIRPMRRAGGLKEVEIKKIFKYAPLVLEQAIKFRGTTFSDYVDSQGKKGNFTKFLRVYGKEGEKCSRCSGYIEKIKLGGRGTRYCANCQK